MCLSRCQRVLLRRECFLKGSKKLLALPPKPRMVLFREGENDVSVNSQSIAHEIVPARMITASVPDVLTIIDDITHGVPIPMAIVSKIKSMDDVASESPIYDNVNSSKGSTPYRTCFCFAT